MTLRRMALSAAYNLEMPCNHLRPPSLPPREQLQSPGPAKVPQVRFDAITNRIRVLCDGLDPKYIEPAAITQKAPAQSPLFGRVATLWITASLRTEGARTTGGFASSNFTSRPCYETDFAHHVHMKCLQRLSYPRCLVTFSHHSTARCRLYFRRAYSRLWMQTPGIQGLGHVSKRFEARG